MGLVHRLLLGIAVLMLATLALSVALVVENTRRAVAAESEAVLDLVVTIADSFRQHADAPLSDEGFAQLQSAVRASRHVCSLSLDPGTRPLPERCSIDGLNGEVPRWFARAVGPGPGVASRILPVQTAGETLPAILLADVRHETIEAWQDVRGLLAFIVAFGAGTLLLASLLVPRSLAPLEHVAAQLRRMSHGDYRSRLHLGVPAELRPIVEGVNGLSASLHEAGRTNRHLARQCLEIQERERADIARELHDEVGQHLTAIEAQLSCLSLGHARQSEPVAQIRHSLRAVFSSVQGILSRLRPSAIDALGLEGAVQQLVADWQSRLPDTRIELHWHSDAAEPPENERMHLYRLLQEALTNVARHARARMVLVEVRLDRHGGVDLRVADDGIGLSSGRMRSGSFGLSGMRERAAAIGAAFEWGPVRGWSTAVQVHRPGVPGGAMDVPAAQLTSGSPVTHA